MNPRDLISIVGVVTLLLVLSAFGLWFFEHSAAKHAITYSAILIVVWAGLKVWYHGEE